ncbi:MAG: iron-sulfur cluster co-chaperone HscB C-terminal domain-containing protein [Planctomycetota bacterium]
MPEPDDPASPTNPFGLFGLEPSIDLDRAGLERAWLRLSAKLHPDRVSESEREAAQARLAVLNDAKAALDDDERRANLVHAHLGGPSASDDKTLPEGLLEHTLAERMAIEDAAASGNTEEIARLREEVAEREQRLGATVKALLERAAAHADGDDHRTRALAEARVQLNAWRYLGRMRERLEGGSDLN